jgi:hypothetical protein
VSDTFVVGAGEALGTAAVQQAFAGG